MSKKINLIGKRFNRLVVIEEYEHKKYNQIFWICRCDCGNITKPISGNHLKSGHTSSCGCYGKSSRKINRKKYNFYEIEGDIVKIYLNDDKSIFTTIDTLFLERIKNYFWYFDGLYVSANNLMGNNKKIRLHRLILELKLNRKLIVGEYVDHINRDRYINTLENLRLSTSEENSYNKSLSKSNKSGYIGVSWRKDIKKFNSIIGINGNKIRLGVYETKEEALVARLKAEKLYFGEFAPQKHLFEKYNI